RLVVFGGDTQKGLRRIAILLALEETLAEPVLRIREQRVARVFLREVLHGCFGERIILALHIADAEIELVARRLRGRRGGKGGAARAARRRWRQTALRIARSAGVGEIERVARPAAARGADRRLSLDRKLAAAECLRGAGGIRVLAGIEGIAAAPAWRPRRRFLDDRRGSRDLLLRIARLGLPITRLRLAVAALRLRWAIGRVGLRRRQRGCDTPLHCRSRTARGRLRIAELPQALFELAVAELQFLVLAGQLPQLVFQPLDAHFRIRILRLREGLRAERQHRGDGHGGGHFEKSA